MQRYFNIFANTARILNKNPFLLAQNLILKAPNAAPEHTRFRTGSTLKHYATTAPVSQKQAGGGSRLVLASLKDMRPNCLQEC